MANNKITEDINLEFTSSVNITGAKKDIDDVKKYASKNPVKFEISDDAIKTLNEVLKTVDTLFKATKDGRYALNVVDSATLNQVSMLKQAIVQIDEETKKVKPIDFGGMGGNLSKIESHLDTIKDTLNTIGKIINIQNIRPLSEINALLDDSAGKLTNISSEFKRQMDETKKIAGVNLFRNLDPDNFGAKLATDIKRVFNGGTFDTLQNNDGFIESLSLRVPYIQKYVEMGGDLSIVINKDIKDLRTLIELMNSSGKFDNIDLSSGVDGLLKQRDMLIKAEKELKKEHQQAEALSTKATPVSFDQETLTNLKDAVKIASQLNTDNVFDSEAVKKFTEALNNMVKTLNVLIPKLQEVFQLNQEASSSSKKTTVSNAKSKAETSKPKKESEPKQTKAKALNTDKLTESINKLKQIDPSRMIEQWKTEVEGLNSRYTELLKTLSSQKPEEQDKAIKALIQDISQLSKQSKNYAKNTNKGELFAFGEVNDSNLKTKALDYLKQTYENVGDDWFKINQTSPTSLIGEYRDLNGVLHQTKFSYDSVTGSLRVFTTESDKNSKAIKNESNVLKAWNPAKSIAQGVAAYLSFRQVFTYIRRGFTEGVNALKEFDSALTTISYTMDLTDKQLRNIGTSAMNMANEMKTSLKNAFEIYEIYANMNTTAEEISETATPTAILANLTGMDAGTAADDLQAVINQFNMASSDASHIVDVFDYVSSNISVDYVKGIKSIADAVENVGNVAYEAGLSFEQLSGIIGTTIQQTRQTYCLYVQKCA